MTGAAALALAALLSRSPADRQALADLAYVLGEAHALRQACSAGDQGWRSRMSRMLEVEAADERFRRRLIDSFNAGFRGRRAEHPSCDAGAAAAARDTAEKGEALARRLGS